MAHFFGPHSEMRCSFTRLTIGNACTSTSFSIHNSSNTAIMLQSHQRCTITLVIIYCNFKFIYMALNRCYNLKRLLLAHIIKTLIICKVWNLLIPDVLSYLVDCNK